MGEDDLKIGDKVSVFLVLNRSVNGKGYQIRDCMIERITKTHCFVRLVKKRLICVELHQVIKQGN